MTFKLKLSERKANGEIVVPTTPLFQEYVRVLGTKPDDRVFDLCILDDGNFHCIAEKLSGKELIDEMIVEYLSSEDKDLPLYYLKLHLTGTGYVLPLISQDRYDELRALNSTR